MTPSRSSTPFNHLYDIYSCGTSVLCTDFIPHCTATRCYPIKPPQLSPCPDLLGAHFPQQAQGNSCVFSATQIKVLKCSCLLDFCGQEQTAPFTSKPSVTSDYPHSKQRFYLLLSLCYVALKSLQRARVAAA